MDWKYKHFNHEAIFNASIGDVLGAARAVMAETFGEIQDSPEGFAARGHSAWHAASATFRVSSAPAGTQLAVELLVERASNRGFMLVDAGGYYNAQIDKWFTRISERLAHAGEQSLVSKTTPSYRIQQGCLAGCVVWLIMVMCLGVAAAALDRGFSSPSTASSPGPFSAGASVVALLTGIVAFLYVVYPEGSISKFIREQIRKIRGTGKQQ